MCNVGSVEAIPRIACIGDSITTSRKESSTLRKGCRYFDSYPTVLKSLVEPSFDVIKAGVGSQTVQKIHSRCSCRLDNKCSYWNTPAWNNVLVSKPDLAIIMLGTNDAKLCNWNEQSFVDDYIDLISILRRSSPGVSVYVATSPPLYSPFPFDMNRTVINERMPELIRYIAAHTGALVIDLHHKYLHHNFSGEPTCDGCHPTEEGTRFIADIMYSHIKSALMVIRDRYKQSH